MPSTAPSSDAGYMSFYDLLDLARLKDGWSVEYVPGPEMINMINRTTTTTPMYAVGRYCIRYMLPGESQKRVRVLKDCERDRGQLMALLMGKSPYAA